MGLEVYRGKAVAWDQSCRMFLYSRGAVAIHLECRLITRHSKQVFVMTDESSFDRRGPIREIGEEKEASLKRDVSAAAGRMVVGK